MVSEEHLILSLVTDTRIIYSLIYNRDRNMDMDSSESDTDY